MVEFMLYAPGEKQGSQLTQDVMTALDERGVVYGVAFIENYAWPRLTAGTRGGELIGEEILENLDRIQEIAQTDERR